MRNVQVQSGNDTRTTDLVDTLKQFGTKLESWIVPQLVGMLYGRSPTAKFPGCQYEHSCFPRRTFTDKHLHKSKNESASLVRAQIRPGDA